MELLRRIFFKSGRRCIGIILALSASAAPVRAASSVTVEWAPNPDPDVVGYFLFNGIVGTSYIKVMDAGNQTRATVTNLFGGVTNFFFVTAYDANGLESPSSEVILTNLPGSFPPPTISAVPGQLIGQNTSTGPIPLTIGDAVFEAGSLRLSGKSSNPALVPNANILFGGAGTNRTVVVVPAIGQTGRTVITVTVADEVRSASTSFLLRVGPASPAGLVYLPFEAESGTLVSPLEAWPDPNASGGEYVSITDFWSGSATFDVDIPVAGAYVIWRRTFALDRSVWSFAVVADDMASHLFDEVLPTGQNAWQWATVSDSFGFEIADPEGPESSQTVFPFAVGRHTISFLGLDTDVRLDEILITNDRNFVPPLLTVPPEQRVNELTTLVVTNTVAGTDLSNVSFSLTAAPSGVSLDPNTGVLSWTPSEAQGPSTNVIGVQVTDNRFPPLSDLASFTVVVGEVNNHAPVLLVPADQRIDELSTLVLTNGFTDADVPPPERGTFSLVAAPEGMLIDPDTGVLIWTPSEIQGPSTNLITVQVSDNGSPPLSDSQSFSIVVNELNRPPILTVPRNRVIHQLATLVVTNTATDPDLPANTLSFGLVSAPEGVLLDPRSGVLIWTPTEAQRPTTNLITVGVTDDGVPPLSDTGSFTVVVNEVNSPPEIAQVPQQTIRPGSLLTLTNSAFDPDIPSNRLTFSLGVAPAGATLEPASGVFAWKPTAAQAESTNAVTIWVTDDGLPQGSGSTTFAIVVTKLAPITLTSISVENNDIRLRVTGDAGILYSLQASPDLDSWNSITNLEAPSTDFELVDTNLTDHLHRFYRVVVP